MPGTLFVVATPIGNLEDLTFRALRVLREVDAIAAEDTRRTSNLLAHYEIRKPLVSLREHNETRMAARLVDRLRAGESIAYVTDAGTPGIADPGARLVAAVRQAGLPIVPVPGASAITTALSVTGLDATEFAFMGFPPPSGSQRQEWFDRLGADRDRVVVFFESPHRIERTLAEASVVCIERPILVHRELTKIHEELVEWNNTPGTSGRLAHLARGELAIVVGPARIVHELPLDEAQAGEFIRCVAETLGLDESEAVRVAARALDVREPDMKRLFKKFRYSVKRQTDE